MAPRLTSSLTHEYQQLGVVLVRPAKLAEADSIATKIVAHRDRYQRVAKSLGVPWYVVGLIHALESSLDFSYAPPQRRPAHRAHDARARRPAAAARRRSRGRRARPDALTFRGFAELEGLDDPGRALPARGLQRLGLPPAAPRRDSPYLWSFSNHYTKGKYVADGNFSATAVSQQCGAAVLLKRLVAAGAVAVRRRCRAPCSSRTRT